MAAATDDDEKDLDQDTEESKVKKSAADRIREEDGGDDEDDEDEKPRKKSGGGRPKFEITPEIQEFLDEKINHRLGRERAKWDTERATLQEKADKHDAAEKAKLSDIERLTAEFESEKKAREATDKELTGWKRKAALYEQCAEAELPKRYWKRVQGDTEEEIAADIQELLDALSEGGNKKDEPRKAPPKGKKLYGGGGGADDDDESVDLSRIPRSNQPYLGKG